MRGQRSLLILIVIPAIVSLAVTLLVLAIWEGRQPEITPLIPPTHGPTSRAASDGGQPPSGGTVASPDSGGEVAGDSTPATDDQPEPTIDPGCQNPMYAVQAGDTLASIARQHGVTVEDLVAINQQADPNFNPDVLSVGQQLIIPVCGIPTATPTEPPTLTATPTIPPPIPTTTELPPGTIRLVIVGVFDLGDITREAVEILNEGSPVQMEDWVLTDGDELEFVFPSFRLFSGGRVAVHTGVGDHTPIDLFWGLNEAIWEAGDTVQLIDPDGELHDEYTIPEP